GDGGLAGAVDADHQAALHRRRRLRLRAGVRGPRLRPARAGAPRGPVVPPPLDAPVRDEAVAAGAEVGVDLDAVGAGVGDVVAQDGRIVRGVRHVDAVLAGGVDAVVLD